jgi:hypothetical protein
MVKEGLGKKYRWRPLIVGQSNGLEESVLEEIFNGRCLFSFCKDRVQNLDKG